MAPRDHFIYPVGPVESRVIAHIRDYLVRLEAAYEEAGVMHRTESWNQRALQTFLTFRFRHYLDGPLRPCSQCGKIPQKANEEIRYREDLILWKLLEQRREEM